MNQTDGAPDPTYGGLQGGDKSQWDLSLDLLDKRLSTDLDLMIRTRSYFDYSEGRTQYVHSLFDYSEERTQYVLSLFDNSVRLQTGPQTPTEAEKCCGVGGSEAW